MPPDAPATEQLAVTNGANNFGLTADEQAAYDAMRSDPAPDGDPGFAPHDAPAEPSEPAPAASEPAEPVAAVQADGGATPAEPDDDDDEPAVATDGAPHPKRVSYNKFKRIEDELKADRAALTAEREKVAKAAETQARLDERLRLINEALTPPPGQQQPQDDDPEPDPEIDIFGHNAWLKRQLVKTQQTFDERIGQIETTRQAETSEQHLASTYMDDAARFAQAEPNFGPAYSYLMQVRTAQLASFHFGKDLTDPATPPLTIQEVAKIKSEVAREEKALVSNALKAGKSPAAAVFAMARMTGYRPQAPVASAGAAPPTNGAQPAANGATPTAGAVAPTAAPNGAKPSVRAEIDKIKSGQDASLSLSRGGGAPGTILNAEKLANMPEEEFGALLDRMSRGELRRVMGG